MACDNCSAVESGSATVSPVGIAAHHNNEVAKISRLIILYTTGRYLSQDLNLDGPLCSDCLGLGTVLVRTYDFD